MYIGKPFSLKVPYFLSSCHVLLQVCDFLHGDNTTLVWDNEQQVPFAYRKDQWVGFDDERSLRTKVFNHKARECKDICQRSF